MKSRFHVLISGDVTGVFFRSYIKEWALKLKLNGFVKNTNNNVEVVFEGESENLKKMLDICRKGPKFSKVENVASTEQEFKNEFKGFRIIP